MKDRLPDTEDRVLCCTKTAKGVQNIVIGYYMNGAWRCGMNSNVTHWMPLKVASFGSDEKAEQFCKWMKWIVGLGERGEVYWND